VFEDNWEALSQMTKADIINENLQKARLVHNKGWRDAIKGLVG
jgi:hypothetical protein